MRIFAERLKYLRTEKELSQRQLALAVNINYKAIQRWENETGIPNAEAVAILAKFFDVSADYLLGLKDE